MARQLWDEIEGRPGSEVLAIQAAKLQRQLASLDGVSDFYREQLRAVGVAFGAVRWSLASLSEHRRRDGPPAASRRRVPDREDLPGVQVPVNEEERPPRDGDPEVVHR